MAKVVVTYKGDTDVDRVQIDGLDVLLGEGTGTFEAQPGRDHALACFVRGAPGSTYTLEITEPTAAAFSRKATVDSSTKDAFLHWFRVDGGGK